MRDARKKRPGLAKEAEIQGVLRAVLVADAASYSRLMPEDPAGTIISLNQHRARMREIVRKNHGVEAGFPGDYLLAVFTAASNALKSAVEFLEPFENPGGEVPLQFRVGLHIGDVFEQAGEFLGVAINVASRLQQSAPVGGIVMSQSFRQSLPGKLRYPVHDVGELRLKNVEEPVRAFELHWQFRTDEGAASPAGAVPAISDREKPSPRSRMIERRPVIHLRPFRALGNAERAVVFADGLVEELITTLSVFSDVFRSVQSAEATHHGEGYEITGQVRDGEGLRITCHLLDRASGNAIWSDRFDFGRDANYDAQERIAVAVITALQVRLTDGESASLWSSRASSLAAWEQFHRGRMCEARYTSDSNRRAKEHFSKAMQIDPEFVSAIVALGFCHLDSIRLGWSADTDGELATAFRLAELAFGKDASDPYAIALLAYVEREHGKLEQSVRTMERAVRIAPGNGELVAYFATMLWMQGDRPGAINQYKRALELIPQPSSWIRTNLGLVMLADGRIQEAQEIFGNVIASDANYVRAHMGLIITLVRKARIDEARERYRSMILIDPGFQPVPWISRNLFVDPKESEQLVADLLVASQ